MSLLPGFQLLYLVFNACPGAHDHMGSRIYNDQYRYNYQKGNRILNILQNIYKLGPPNLLADIDKLFRK